MTQVNMNYPCTSTFQSPRITPRLPGGAPKAFDKDAFKTSNPQIFPSLHPLSNFYRARKDVHPNPMTSGKTEVVEPVKKQKMNEVVSVPRVQVPQVAVRETKVQKIKDEVLDQDGFRIPKLPRRLCGQTTEPKKSKIANKTQNTSAFVVPDIILENLKSHGSDLLQNQLLKSETEVKTQSFKPVKQQNSTNWVAKNNEQQSQTMDPMILSVLYDRLRQEYMALYLRQNVQALFELSQNVH